MVSVSGPLIKFMRGVDCPSYLPISKNSPAHSSITTGANGRNGSRNLILTLTVSAAACAASAAARVASAVAWDALPAASLALIAAFLLLSSVSRLKPIAVFSHATENTNTPAAHAHRDSRRIMALIDDLLLDTPASDVPVT